MPGMDGLTFARLLRKRAPGVPIVLLTSGTLPTGEPAQACDARLLKPYRQSQLFEAIARVVSLAPAVSAVAKAEPAAVRNQLVLVADDNPINLKVAQAMLAKLGYEAATAVNGSEAVDQVAASLRTGRGEVPRRYAAILMDANMPVMDGFAASRSILATHGRLAPSIIALTASVLEEDRQRCREAGMVGFLPKPLRIDELSEALTRHARQPEDMCALKAIADSLANSAQEPLFVNHPAPVLIDWGRLDQFREFDDEALSMMQEVLMLFVGETPQRIDDIRRALATVTALPCRAARMRSKARHPMWARRH